MHAVRFAARLALVSVTALWMFDAQLGYFCSLNCVEAVVNWACGRRVLL